MAVSDYVNVQIRTNDRKIILQWYRREKTTTISVGYRDATSVEPFEASIHDLRQIVATLNVRIAELETLPSASPPERP